ncbi:MAG: restriction endonuclease subunit S [Bacteroidales bacterium]|nr:restriction endonuclease subunit S [Bacteroidales bacterium]
MQRYDTYKDSCVKWLGEIPSHWEVISTKYIAELYTGNSLNDASKEKYSLFSDDSYPYIASKDISLGTGTVDYDNGLYIPKDESFFEIAPKNSFLLCIEGGSAGRKKAFLDRNCCFVNKLCCFDSVLNPKYHYYFIQGDYFRTMFNCSLQGMIGGVSVSSLKNFYTIVPPLEEQTAIASYLDTATAKIDAAIAQQQKMIDLLNERKQIIINRAVTRGLNPNARMKDSGVEWIGEVPEGWEVRRLKHLLKASLMYGANESAESEDESYPRYIRITDIDEDGKLRPDTFRSLPPKKAEPYLLKKGDLLFARSGATAGKTYLFNEDIKACFAGYLIKASLREPLLPEYLDYYTRSGIYDNWKKSIFIQATIPNIGAEKYANLQITLPSIKEQKDIVKHLDVETGKINQVVRNCKNQISLLQERKQIIINEVVTGKVKVI